MTRTTRSRSTRVVHRTGVIALAAGLAATSVAVWLTFFPVQDPVPQHADVAFVLGAPTDARVATAQGLLDRGVVSTILISVPYSSQFPGAPYYEEWHDCSGRVDTICDIASPPTTQGEARMLTRYAKQRGWKSAIVITQTAHITRSRWIMQRCFGSAGLTMLESGEAPDGGVWAQFTYQTAAALKALLKPGC